MTFLRVKIATLLDGLSIALIMFLGGSLVWSYVAPHVALRRGVSLKSGSALPVSGVSWGPQKVSLVFVLSTNCHYCQASLGFYRELLGANELRPVFQPVTVMPQSESQIREYLDRNNIHITLLRSMPLSAVGAPGSPTLILVDQHGRVLRSWVGKLVHEEESDVFGAVGLERGTVSLLEHPESFGEAKPSFDEPLISPNDAAHLLATKPYEGSTLIDVRPRDEYSTVHMPRAISLPADEISSRAPVEINPDKDVFVYCDTCTACELKQKRIQIPAYCDVSLKLLNRAGINHVHLVALEQQQNRSSERKSDRTAH